MTAKQNLQKQNGIEEKMEEADAKERGPDADMESETQELLELQAGGFFLQFCDVATTQWQSSTKGITQKFGYRSEKRKVESFRNQSCCILVTSWNLTYCLNMTVLEREKKSSKNWVTLALFFFHKNPLYE